MKNFKQFLLQERLNINLEVLNLSEYIYDNILKQGKVKKIKLPDNSLGIKWVIIDYINSSDSALEFDLKKSGREKIYLYFSKDCSITLDNIQHEMNHALKFIKQGKENTLNKFLKLKSVNLTKTFFNNDFFNDFLAFKYFSQIDEIDSYMYNLEKQIIEKLSTLKSKSNHIFKTILDNMEIYKLYKNYLLDYDPNDLRVLGHDQLLLMFNIIEDNYHFLIKKRNNFHSVLRSIYQIIFKKRYIENLDIKITNLDQYIQKLVGDKEKSIQYFNHKIDKLYASVMEKI